jgi:two-component system response regulator VicR
MARHTVLLLEDDTNLGAILQEHLELNGFAVTLCTNGEEGLAAYRRSIHTLCLVDVMMPRVDGFAFARRVRQADRDTPIIFLTARSLKEDRIEGLKIGADDYVTKPFSMEELLLRIRAVLRRSGQEADPLPAVCAIGEFAFDYAKRVLERRGKKTRLTSREADLLRLLSLHLNAPVDRSEALKELWGDDGYYNSRSMDVFLSKLRKHLRGDPRVEIQNIHGKGVKLVVG